MRSDEIKTLSVRQWRCSFWITEALIRERLEWDGDVSVLLNYGSWCGFSGLLGHGFSLVRESRRRRRALVS